MREVEVSRLTDVIEKHAKGICHLPVNIPK